MTSSPSSTSFDKLDLAVLRLVMEQPRAGVREYARLLGVARATVQSRLDRLVKDGAIDGWAPPLSPAALGFPVLAFVHVDVAQERFADVPKHLAEIPELIEAYSVAGEGDILCRVVARDNVHLEAVIERMINTPGVVRTRTEIALNHRVAHRVLPLVGLLEARAGGTYRPPVTSVEE
ncbi:DNA-binding Lrp family transcriptional regulator [Crossiella equi]|uniref:DNA-binding Lrp family transcriptional regulator n=1 Tax=Crossiella equi TaxID=130796 RepID=A0ABS5ANM7_9PSEU|nr:Lrp/AsnC family transcriptional regulator [Crossiella equi]MBP2477842.1 DNA-binding Lrp family transcriptional regulator [Crossiella equi]